MSVVSVLRVRVGVIVQDEDTGGAHGGPGARPPRGMRPTTLAAGTAGASLHPFIWARMAPREAPSQEGTPQNGTPQNGTPQNGTPQNGTPQNGTKKECTLLEPVAMPPGPMVTICMRKVLPAASTGMAGVPRPPRPR